jgi:hypothetical protein
MARAIPIFIVASCTQQKTKPVPYHLRLRRFSRQRDASSRARIFYRALRTASKDSIAATSLYSGAFWSVIKALPDIARQRGFEPRLLVASAGYGLLSGQAHVQPYSATFAGRDEDSVAHPNDDRATREVVLTEWWRSLSTLKGPRGHVGPRTLEGFAKSVPDACILVVASPEYVAAMSEDIKRAAAALRDPNHLAIVSSVSGFPKSLKTHLVPSVAKLQGHFGGPLGSLHARTARRLLESSKPPIDARKMAAKSRRLARIAPVYRLPKRVVRTDHEVRAFIRRRLASHAPASCSALLREYRDGGSKCEQKRFRSLFDEVTRQRKAS